MFQVDDDDDTLTAIREAILSAAPNVERLVAIPRSFDDRRMTEQGEIAAAIATADELAERRFGLALQETKNG